MLEDLQIRNFRRNKKLDISLGQITTIRGATGKGKSSLVGALKWALFNRPSGDSFINWDAEYAAVRLIFDGNQKLIRRKSKSANVYKLNGERFKAFGTGVPEPVVKALNVRSINFRPQHAGHFWFSETAGEVARQLNDIVDLTIIDTTLANLASYQRTTRDLITFKSAHIKELEDQQEELDFVDEMESDFSKLENQHYKTQDSALDCSRLDDLCREGTQCRLTRDRASERAQDAQIVLSAHKQACTTEKSVRKLESLLDQVESNRILSNKRIPDINPLLDSQTALEDVGRDEWNLKVRIARAEAIISDIKSFDEQLSKKQAVYREKMKGACPLCGRK